MGAEGVRERPFPGDFSAPFSSAPDPEIRPVSAFCCGHTRAAPRTVFRPNAHERDTPRGTAAVVPASISNPVGPQAAFDKDFHDSRNEKIEVKENCWRGCIDCTCGEPGSTGCSHESVPEP